MFRKMSHTFEAEQWLPFPLEGVFGFFANPENLPRLMPRWQRARIEEAQFRAPPPRPVGTPVLPGVVAGAGTRMTISFRAFPMSPIRVPWDAEITEFVWNDHFCDVQHRGPFRLWKHCHRLTAEAREVAGRETPGTMLRDHVEFEPPMGVLGQLGMPVVRMQLASMFQYRHRRTAELLAKAFPGGG